MQIIQLHTTDLQFNTTIMIGAYTSIVHDTRTIKKDNTYPVKLRLTYQREQKYYPLGISLATDDWDKITQTNPRKTLKDNKLFFAKMEEKATIILKDMDQFSFEAFEKKFLNTAPSKKELFTLIQDYIDNLTGEERYTTAESYTSTLNSFTEYIKELKKNKLLVREITPEWLTNYEKWKIGKGTSPSTVGIYMRNLRAVLNLAIVEGNFLQENYPFGKRKYQIPASRNIKKALRIEDIRKVIEYVPKTDAEQKAKDIWVFSYLANGINMKDIALLQYKNIGQKNITFVRAKTERSTKKDLKPVVVPILPELKNIIDKWGLPNTTPETYVFGFVSKEDSAIQRVANIKQATKTVNKYMKRIGTDLKLDLNLTTYVARHSYATVMKRSGAPIELISESLGHKDLVTTENYLDSFEDDIKRSYQENLLKFD